jgi:hypothetical protein
MVKYCFLTVVLLASSLLVKACRMRICTSAGLSYQHIYTRACAKLPDPECPSGAYPGLCFKNLCRLRMANFDEVLTSFIYLFFLLRNEATPPG